MDDEATTAFHEAGHAILQIALGIGCKIVTIVPDPKENSAGASTHGGEWGQQASGLDEEDDDVAQLRMLAEDSFWMRHIIAYLAGAEAVRRSDPARSDWKAGADDDYRQADFALDNITEDDESVKHLRAYLERRTALLVEHYWPDIHALSDVLRVEKTIDGERARCVFMDSLEARRARLWFW